MKTIIVVLIVAFAGYYAYRAGYLKPDMFNSSGGTASTPSEGGGAKAESLEKTLNRGLPRMVTNEISLDRAVANNVQVVFNYRFVELDQFAVTQRYGSSMPADVQNAVVRDLCGKQDVRDQVLARGREVLLQIHAQDGRTVFSAQLRPGGC
ncbi:MAG TPA: hypothetical protein VF943_15390 [Burkholderiales bacterium]